MARFGQFTIVALIVIAAGMYAVFSHVYGGDKEAVMESLRVLSERLGKWTIPLFVIVHALLISLCLPYAIIFEAGAAYLFGFFQGVLCVFSAKVLSASFSFWIGRTLFRSSTAASSWVRNNKFFRVISEGVARDGWRFVLLARFSPLPSYIINYSLAATDVRFTIDFLLPTMVGCIPMILQNTSIGSLTSAATHTGGESKKTGLTAYIFPMIGLASGVLISWRIKNYASNISAPLTMASDNSKDNSDNPKDISDSVTKGVFEDRSNTSSSVKLNQRHRTVTCAAS